jgi:hypothetical protein
VEGPEVIFEMSTKSKSPGLIFLVILAVFLSVGPSGLAIPTGSTQNGGNPNSAALTRASRQAGHHGKHRGARSVAVPTAASVFTTLGSAGPSQWTVLEVGAGAVTQQGQINGNVGLQQKARLQGSGPVIQGDMYMGNKSSAAFSNASAVTGTVHLANATIASPAGLTTMNDRSAQTKLNQARSDAISASSMASSMASTSSLPNINLASASMTLGAGVYNLSSFNLDHSTLTLSGSGYYVFNITSSFVLNSAKVLLANGAVESNILFNYTGKSTAAFTGGGQDQSVLHGILLALNAKVNLSPGLVVGEIISGQDILIGPGSVVQQGAVTVPDGASTFGLSVIALSGIAAFYSFTLRNRARRVRPA